MRKALRILAVLALPAMSGFAADKRPIGFSGEVVGVDLKMHTVAVRHGVIPGYMPALTLDYMVDDDALLLRLAPSDRITATVFVGDPTLHHIRVVGHGTKNAR